MKIHPEVLSSHVWSISKIGRCCDLAFIFKSHGEIFIKIEEATDSLAGAQANMKLASEVGTPAGVEQFVTDAVSDLKYAEAAIREALSLIPADFNDRGAIANLRAGLKAINEEIVALYRY